MRAEWLRRWFRAFTSPSRSQRRHAPHLQVERLETRLTPAQNALLALGAGEGGAPHVRVFEAESGQERLSFFAYDAAVRGGVRVATGDVNGDGTLDLITGPVVGGPNVRVFDGLNGNPLANFFAFDPSFTGGINVAAGDVDQDGYADVIVGAGVGGAPQVQVYSGASGQLLSSFFAYDPALRGGVDVSVGDVTGDGTPDIVTGAGPGGGPHVRTFDRNGGEQAGPFGSFFAYDTAQRGGVDVALGDTEGDGVLDLITGAGPGGGPHVRVWQGKTGTELASFFAYDAAQRGGVTVAADELTGDTKADVITGAGGGGAPHVRTFAGGSFAEASGPLGNFFGFSPDFRGGVSVGAGGGLSLGNFRIQEVTPTDQAEAVALTREVVVRFSERVDPSTVTTESIKVLSLDRVAAGRVVVSDTGRFATFFPDNPWRSSANLRIFVDGNLIRSADGNRLDADGDGFSGGVYSTDYRTQSADRVAGTNVTGVVLDAYTRNPEGSNRPVVGATIRVTGLPEITAVTDENGRFTLVDLPAGGVFIDVDGSTATNAPTGMTFANRPFSIDTEGGRTIPLRQRGVEFASFLPPLSDVDLVELRTDAPTVVGFGPVGLAEAAQVVPTVSLSDLGKVRVEFPAGSATNEQGVPATKALVIPVAPERLPSPLPGNLTPKLVISVQPVGATNLDEPAKLVFPNLEGLAPGEKAYVWEFDRDEGAWIVVGSATVSADGSEIVSDPGSGVRAPGWHAVQSGATVQRGYLDMLGDLVGNTLSFVGGVLGLGFDMIAEASALLDVFVPIPIADQALNVITASAGLLGDVVSGDLNAQSLANFSVSIAGAFDLDPVSGTVLDAAAAGLTTIETVGDVVDTASSGISAVGNVLEIGGNLAVDTFNLVTGFFSSTTRSTQQAAAQGTNLLGGITTVQEILTTQKQRNTASGNKKAARSVNLDLVPLTDPQEVANLIQNLDADLRPQLQAALNQIVTAGTALQQTPGGSIGGTIEQLRTQLPAFTNQLRALLATTRKPAAGARVSIDLGGGVVLHTQTDSKGNLNVNLPSNRTVDARIFIPSRNSFLVDRFSTGKSGSTTKIATPAEIVPLSKTFHPDTDSDGLFDPLERALGTRLDQIDSDNDGIPDPVEIAQNTNPLGNATLPVGVIGSLTHDGNANMVVVDGPPIAGVTRLGFVATSLGLLTVDVTDPVRPIQLGQLQLNSNNTDVAVSRPHNRALLTAGTAGVQVVEVTDPRTPTLVRTVLLPGNVPANRVEVIGGFGYVAGGNQVFRLDPVTGALLGSLVVSPLNAPLVDLAFEGGTLYALDTNSKLYVIDAALVLAGSVQVPSGPQGTGLGGGRLTVANGIAYVATANNFSPAISAGYATVDVTRATAPTLMSPSQFEQNTTISRRELLLNGTGLALQVGGNNQPTLSDISDPTTPGKFLQNLNVGATTITGIAMDRGIAFLAGASNDLRMVNFLATDTQGKAPTATIVLADTLADTDPTVPGIQVRTGAALPIFTTPTDDFQIERAELLVNGALADTAFSFPYRFVAGAFPAADQSTVEVQVRVTDMGGNVGLSNVLTFEVAADTTAPTFQSATPLPDTTIFNSQGAIEIRFSEPLDAASVTPPSVLSEKTVSGLWRRDPVACGFDALEDQLCGLCPNERFRRLVVFGQVSLNRLL